MRSERWSHLEHRWCRCYLTSPRLLMVGEKSLRQKLGKVHPTWIRLVCVTSFTWRTLLVPSLEYFQRYSPAFICCLSSGSAPRHHSIISGQQWSLSQQIKTQGCILGCWPWLYHGATCIARFLRSANLMVEANGSQSVTSAFCQSCQTWQGYVFFQLPVTYRRRLGHWCLYFGNQSSTAVRC